MKENEVSEKIYSLQKPWYNNQNEIWMATSISLKRNIEFAFPSKLDPERLKQIVSLVGKDLVKCVHLDEPILIKAEEIGTNEKQYLVEHFLTEKTFQAAHSEEAFVIDKSGQFLTVINIDDHLHFEKLEETSDLESAWNDLVKIETCLGKSLNYAYSSKYGFLTSNPGECGTALQVSAFFQLPGLNHTNKLEQVFENLADDNIVISGLQGTRDEIIGDVYIVENNYTMGVTEENILASIRSFGQKLLAEEKAVREKITQEPSEEIKDRISRALAILTLSYKIDAIEALNAISLVKLGAELGWVSGVSILDLNLLFSNCRRAHLLRQFKENISQEELPHKRAEFIHKQLANAKLNI